MGGRANPVRYYKAQRRLAGLGSLINPLTIPNTIAPAPSNAPPEGWLIQSVPSSSPYDFAYNAATGNVSPAQKQQLVANQTAALIQAGVDPTSAAQQAQDTITTALTTYSGPGAFGVPWTGADPSQSWPTQISNLLQSSDPTFNVPFWVWLAGGGFLLFVLWRK
jgi:hypothetical protein